MSDTALYERIAVGPNLVDLPGVNAKAWNHPAVFDWASVAFTENESDDGEPTVLLLSKAGSPTVLAVKAEELPEFISAFVAAHYGVMSRKIAKARGVKDDPAVPELVRAFKKAHPTDRMAAFHALGLDYKPYQHLDEEE